MTSGRPRSAGLAAWWVDVYTRTAPVDEAADRRGEVESDLHEQAAAAAARGTPARRVSWEIAGRLVRGMPADLAWRVEVEQAPGRLRWHLQHPATVYAAALLVLIPLGLVADGTRTRGDVHRWSAAGALGLAALVGCAVVVAFGLVSLAYLRPSLGALRRVGARRVRPFLVCVMSFLWALAGVWRFVPNELSTVSALAWGFFGVALVAYLLAITVQAVVWLLRVDLRKVSS